MKKINIAIDGPAASGKTSIAKLLATKLDFNFLDTGKMYRAFTYFCLKNNIDINNKNEIKKILKTSDFKLIDQSIFINNELIQPENMITKQVTSNINKISNLNFVRKKMNVVQRDFAKDKKFILVGRDIGTIVLPDAEIKIFLNANIKNRAKRRFEELKNEYQTTYEETFNDLKNRDLSDKTRKTGPLVKAKDAVIIDNSNLSLSETLNIILEVIRQRGFYV